MSKAQELKPELLPCPMCGGTEILVKKRKTTMVECKACGLVVFNYQDGIERDAIAHWNTRAPASSDQQAAQQDAERWRFFRDEPEIQACTEDLYGKLIRNADDLDHAVDTEMSADAARASNGGKAND